MAQLIAILDQRDNSCFLIGRLGHRLVAALTIRGGGLARMVHVGRLMMYVAADVRGQGIGRAMMDIAIPRYESCPQLAKLSLWVFEDKSRAVALCEAFGFQLEGRNALELGYPEGKARARSLRSVLEYVSRHRSEQRRMAGVPVSMRFCSNPTRTGWRAR